MIDKSLIIVSKLQKICLCISICLPNFCNMITLRFSSINAIFFVIALFSCSKSSKNVNDSTFAKFKNFNKSSFYQVNVDNITNSNIILKDNVLDMKVVDSILLISNYKDSLQLSVVNLNTFNFINKLIVRGNNVNECLNITDIISVDNKTVWFYDITLGKFMKTNVSDIIDSTKKINFLEIFEIDDKTKRIRTPCWESDSVFSGTSYFRNDTRFSYISKSSKILKEVGVLPDPVEGWPDEKYSGIFSLLATLYSANLNKCPSVEKHVVSYRTASRIEFYNKDSLYKILFGPDQIKPTYEFNRTGDHLVATSTPQTKYTNVRTRVTDKLVYILYSGNESTCGSNIFTFDWNGNPVKMFKFPQEFCIFDVVEKNIEGTYIYYIEQSTGCLISSKLD